ncbi:MULTISPECIES: aminotransferase class V-fold PLP-dependent enzyme [Flavobacteriaceae]|uniref:aminotransferase class V-fold PLP-dependent enzyme n=1 Tax=Flavobacteriaceae TaxID=49546 RepID=UPI00234B1D02|nr:aminotransferase class V-fold PLP-dependent enzyme [Muricauda sp. SP22]MDC6363669.1 aminotransferase class V-fold PLP-dependent enzyme [Muricauda sp. SP22]
MKRREIIKQLGVVPVAGSLMASQSMLGGTLGNVGPLMTKSSKGPNIYESLGVDTIINCRGTFTILGGSTERPEVIEAIEAASGYFVQYDELAEGIGRRLAEITKADWGMVSAGCAAGMKHVTAACVTGGNPEKLIRIPHIDDFEKNEVIIPRSSRNYYDHAIRNIGVKVITVDSPEEMREAINPRTAMIYIMTGDDNETGKPLSLEVISEIAKPKNIPILADAAAEDLSIPCVHLERGATVVAYSGGKAICGPQCAGLLLGDKDLLMAAWQASSPHHGPGRDNKVGKEEMLGMLAAVEAWTTRDHDKEWQTWLGWLDEISSKLTKIDGITSEVTLPKGLNNRTPRLILKWDPDKLNITGEEVAEEVARNKPRIAIGGWSRGDSTSINITPSQMRPGNAKVVADRLYEVLSQKREPISDEMVSPSEDISGHWEVDVAYFTSNSGHKFFLEQDGNWISGSHTSEYASQDIIGMIEGDEVVLRSNFRIPGNGISFWFIGKISNGELSGSVFLGEYLTAKFAAKKVSYRQNRTKLNVPGGPPLAT